MKIKKILSYTWISLIALTIIILILHSIYIEAAKDWDYSLKVFYIFLAMLIFIGLTILSIGCITEESNEK